MEDSIFKNEYEGVRLPHGMGNRELFPNGRFEIFKHKKELRSFAKVYFEQKFHGPPRHVHGGAQAYILDEIMGCTGWMHHFAVVAKKIDVSFLQPVPIETDLVGYGEIIGQRDQFLDVVAKICDKDGAILSQSQGEFRILTDDKLEQFIPT